MLFYAALVEGILKKTDLRCQRYRFKAIMDCLLPCKQFLFNALPEGTHGSAGMRGFFKNGVSVRDAPGLRVPISGTGRALSLRNILFVEILAGQARPIHDRGIILMGWINGTIAGILF